MIASASWADAALPARALVPSADRHCASHDQYDADRQRERPADGHDEELA
jgi:hypothetical protein